MSDISFATDSGPMIDGTWQNMQTGDVFEVQDSFFQDGQLIIQAKDGRMFDYNTIQTYVKVEKPIPIEKPKAKKKPLPRSIESELESSPIEGIEGDILDDDLALINGRTLDEESLVESRPKVNTVKSDDEKMVERVLQRASDPEVTCEVSWNKFPSRQLEMLVDFMGVDPQLVVNYYIDKLNVSTIKEMLGKQILDFISDKLNPEENEDKADPKPKKSKTTK